MGNKKDMILKLLIFESYETRAVYSWNGSETVTIIAAPNRPLGKIMEGLDNEILDKAYKENAKLFEIGSATYSVIVKL